MYSDVRLADGGGAKRTCAPGLGMLLVAALATQAPAQHRILLDDFNDGNDDGWIHLDDIADKPFGPAIYDASSGEYRLASTGPVWTLEEAREYPAFAAVWAPSVTDPVFYSDGLFRFRFRIDGEASRLAFAMRAEEVAPGVWSFYRFGADSRMGGANFNFNRVEAGVGQFRFTGCCGQPRLHDEWMLEAGAIGDRLTMKWWPVGAPEPSTPQWEGIDPDPLGPGICGTISEVVYGAIRDHNVPPPWRIDATIDDLYFTQGPALVQVAGGAGPDAASYISPRAASVPFDSFQVELTTDATLTGSAVNCTGDPADCPGVAGMSQDGGGMHTLTLDGPVPVGQWARITLDLGGASVTVWVAHLPDDIDQSGDVDITDATRFGNEFSGDRTPLLIDLNGDGVVNVRDATVFGEMWRGQGAQGTAWANQSLPPRPESSGGTRRR